MEIKEIFESMEYGPAPESSDKVDKWLEDHDRTFELFINGKWVKPSEDEYFDSINPSNGEKMAAIAAASKSDVDTAVNAAKKAQKEWWAMGSHKRARYIYAIARQIQKHARLFAVLESMDNGKPIRETRDIDVPLVARHFYHHAGWAQTMDHDMPDYEPLGVIGAIVPWNFPLLIFTWKVAPALATGNTVVIKPAKLTSLSAILFAQICEAVNLPPGVFNLVTGSGSKTGTYLTDHKDVAKLTFTGSTEVGKILRRAIAGSGKKITLELGGKSPFIVYEDADLDSAIEGIVDAIWFNQGQVCCAGSRLLIQESIEDKFIRKLKARMEKLRVGPALDKAIDIGAVVDKNQLDTIASYVDIGVKEGGELYQPQCDLPEVGYYHLPTLFTGVSTADTIVQEEIFGPVLVAMSFRTPAEAVELANNTRYGLAASIWTENLNLAFETAPKIKAGTIWINCTNMFDASSGFGGYRESGFGREGGIEGLWDFMKPKWESEFKTKPFKRATVKPEVEESEFPPIDRTAKMYIGGKQARPDGNYSYEIHSPEGDLVGEASLGNRKDIRNAVEAANAAIGWQVTNKHNVAQILYYIAENLDIRKKEFAERLVSMTHVSFEDAMKEVSESIYRIYYYAAKADKWDGNVHHTPYRNITLAMPEAVGVLGIVLPNEFPLLAFVSTVIPAIARGNTVVVIPSETHPLSATDMYQIFETSDVPGGVVNIVTGNRDELTPYIADHDSVEGIWYFGDKKGSKDVELRATENMKRSWVSYGKHRDWMNRSHGMGDEFLRKATEIKNIWTPYGETM
ncbi:MAG: aldehyde dehydrogenase family protein [Candidatus Kariarchaeaceae archaeon]|jgi:aldehyde dehydrogenase (NAD+)